MQISSLTENNKVPLGILTPAVRILQPPFKGEIELEDCQPLINMLPPPCSLMRVHWKLKYQYYEAIVLKTSLMKSQAQRARQIMLESSKDCSH